MKKVQIFSITQTGTLLFCQGSQVREGSIQGISICPSVQSRFALRDILFKEVECSLAKGGKIRCKDIAFMKQILQSGGAGICQKELEESKVFDQQQKDILKSSAGVDIKQVSEKNKEKIIDFTQNRNILMKDMRKKVEKDVRIQSLGEEILVSYEDQQTKKIVYIPIKLQRIDHYFHLIQNCDQGQFIKNHMQVKVTLYPSKYNLSRKTYVVQSQFQSTVQKSILERGWGTLSIKNLTFMSIQDAKQFRNLQFQAKANHRGIFKKPFEILSLIYTKNNLVGKVESIIEGYILMIRTKDDSTIKLEFSKIYCPIQNEIGAFECREFARKNLIGKEVNIFLNKDEGLTIQGSIVRFSDNKDVETLMIENGYGFVKEELKGTMLSGKLENLEKKARQNNKGIHNQKKMGVQLYEDLTIHHQKKEKTQKKLMIDHKIKCLQNLEVNEEGVILSVIDANTYGIRADKSKKILRVRLDGIIKISVNPKLKEIEELNKKIEDFTFKNFNQRTVFLNLTDYDTISNNFIGIVQVQGRGKQRINMQQVLLQEGLVYLSETGSFEESWIKCMQSAQQTEKNIWSQKIRNIWRQKLYEEQPKQFRAKVSWVENGELVYIQPEVANEKLDFIYDDLNKDKLQPIKPQNIVVGYLCGSEYMGEICRAKILTINEKSIYVLFIDWGNKETVQAKGLFEIPENLQYIPPMCCQVKLDIVRPLKIKTGEHVEKVREFIMEGQCKVEKIYGNLVNLYTQKQEHMNHILVEEGLLKADLSKINNETLRIHYEKLMENLRKNLIGVWDAEEDQEEIDEYDYL